MEQLDELEDDLEDTVLEQYRSGTCKGTVAIVVRAKESVLAQNSLLTLPFRLLFVQAKAS